MKNLTIRIDEEVAAWARARAAKQGTSVSKMVGEMLRDRMLEEVGYQAAMEDWMAWKPRPLRDERELLPARESLHERRG
jgi:plasmid stability protein